MRVGKSHAGQKCGRMPGYRRRLAALCGWALLATCTADPGPAHSFVDSRDSAWTECSGADGCDDTLAENNSCQQRTCTPTGDCEVRPRPDGTVCDDGNPCTQDDQCRQGSCQSLTFADCSDGIDCTEDSCHADFGGCVHTPNPERCQSVTACQAAACDPRRGCIRVALADGAPCDDGDICTRGDLCTAGICVPGEPVADCQCSADEDCQRIWNRQGTCAGPSFCDRTSSDRSGGQCKWQPEAASACEPAPDGGCWQSVCNPQTGGCIRRSSDPGTPCDDFDPCTADDRCVADACVGLPDRRCLCQTDADCMPFDDSDLCNGRYRCQPEPDHAWGQCVLDGQSIVHCAQPQPCRHEVCRPESGQCEPVLADDATPCDDGNACTIDDTCAAGVCMSGEPIACAEGNACTAATCDPLSGQCLISALPSGTPCDDGNACTVGDTCMQGICQPGPAVLTCCTQDADCADDNPCTGETCQDRQCVVSPVACEPTADCVVPVCLASTGACAPLDMRLRQRILDFPMDREGQTGLVRLPPGSWQVDAQVGQLVLTTAPAIGPTGLRVVATVPAAGLYLLTMDILAPPDTRCPEEHFRLQGPDGQQLAAPCPTPGVWSQVTVAIPVVDTPLVQIDLLWDQPPRIGWRVDRLTLDLWAVNGCLAPWAVPLDMPEPVSDLAVTADGLGHGVLLWAAAAGNQRTILHRAAVDEWGQVGPAGHVNPANPIMTAIRDFRAVASESTLFAAWTTVPPVEVPRTMVLARIAGYTAATTTVTYPGAMLNLEPRLALQGDRVLLVWSHRTRADDSQAVAQVFSTQAIPQDAAFAISADADGTQQQPVAVPWSSTVWLALWTSRDAEGQSRIHGRLLTESGPIGESDWALSELFPEADHDDDTPAVAAVADGQFAAFWVRRMASDPSEAQLVGAYFDGSGMPLCDLSVLATLPEPADPRTALAAAPDGTQMLVWQAAIDPLGPQAMFALVLDALPTVALAQPIRLTPPEVPDSFEAPSVAFLGPDLFLLAMRNETSSQAMTAAVGRGCHEGAFGCADDTLQVCQGAGYAVLQAPPWPCAGPACGATLTCP